MMTEGILPDRYQRLSELGNTSIPRPGFRMLSASGAVTFKRLEAGRAQILIQDANPPIGNNINRACHRKGRDWGACRKGLQQHQTKGISA
jgi:hypothetical protein